MTVLNAAFESKLTLEDDGYESGSETFNIPTPLRWTPRIHHVSSDEHISFDPSTPHSTVTSQSHCMPVQCQLSFSTSDNGDSSVVNILSTYSTATPQNPMGFAQQPPSKSIFTMCDDLEEDEEEEDFQTVTLDDDHWTTEEIPDRHLCIHKHSIPHSLCPYPCPYMDYTSTSYHDTLDLSDISEFKDLMTTSSDEDIPALDGEIGYWNLQTMVSIYITLAFNFILDNLLFSIELVQMFQMTLLWWILFIGYFWIYFMSQHLNKC